MTLVKWNNENNMRHASLESIFDSLFDQDTNNTHKLSIPNEAVLPVQFTEDEQNFYERLLLPVSAKICSK